MSLDTKIISDCKRGKSYAQSRIYDLYSGAMLATCLRYIKDRAKAEDVLQEAFVKIFKNVSNYEFETVGNFSAWLKRIVVNTALNYIRDNKKHDIFSDVDADNYELLSYDPEEENNQKLGISQEEILKLIQDLPEGYRIVFNLYVFEKYSHQDIAAELGISVNTSKTQLFKARKILQKNVKEILRKKDNSLVNAL